MRTYRADQACAFRFSRAEWGEFSNFCPLPTPIPAGPWLFPTSEHLYQACKVPTAPESLPTATASRARFRRPELRASSSK